MTTSPTGKIPAGQPPASKGAGRDIGVFVKRFWLPIILVILAIIFIATNTNDTPLTIGWVTINSPLWLTITVTVIVGFVIGWFVGRRGKSD
ncbi:LapA family protein [Gordonia sp. (in: high G+C Gram-positive bacteria)]|uniref:LapA family protein n=1 Tax=Gordonia sp. (in: high G+C Gram-positive bacteria) TaxID=84139 RepID=UPI003528D635